MSRAVLERQLTAAQQRRDKQAGKLSERGFTDKQYRKDPIWRHWKSQCRKLAVRLRRVAVKETFAIPATDGDADAD